MRPLILLALLLSPPAFAAPAVPADDGVVLERLPTARDPAVAELRRLHAALARQPDNMTLAVSVARRDVAEARSRADPRFNGYAEAALAPWWGLADPPAPVRLVRATVEQSNHDFDAALADLDSLLARDPHDAQARLTRALVHQVRAEYTAARLDCEALGQPSASFAAAICADGVQGLAGDYAAAAGDLAQATDGPGARSPAPLREWALTVLAEFAAHAGERATAEQRFQAARALDPADAYLLGAYADFLLDQDRPADVVALLAAFARVDPLLLRLAIAERRLGAPAAAGHVADLADRFAASAARGETVHRREQARFTLELLAQPGPALALAVANYAVQREPADARVLLECALAANAPAAAAPALRWLAGTSLPDARMHALAERLAGGAR